MADVSDFYDHKTGEVTGRAFYVPCYYGFPFITLLDGSDDKFTPVFSSIHKLHDFMQDFRRQVQGPAQYTTLTVRWILEYAKIHFAHKVRIMADPVIVSPEYTRYNEMIERDGKLYMRGGK